MMTRGGLTPRLASAEPRGPGVQGALDGPDYFQFDLK